MYLPMKLSLPAIVCSLASQWSPRTLGGFVYVSIDLMCGFRKGISNVLKSRAIVS
jgi:hypothetical protein